MMNLPYTSDVRFIEEFLFIYTNEEFLLLS